MVLLNVLGRSQRLLLRLLGHTLSVLVKGLDLDRSPLLLLRHQEHIIRPMLIGVLLPNIANLLLQFIDIRIFLNQNLGHHFIVQAHTAVLMPCW